MVIAVYDFYEDGVDYYRNTCCGSRSYNDPNYCQFCGAKIDRVHRPREPKSVEVVRKVWALYNGPEFQWHVSTHDNAVDALLAKRIHQNKGYPDAVLKRQDRKLWVDRPEYRHEYLGRVYGCDRPGEWEMKFEERKRDTMDR